MHDANKVKAIAIPWVFNKNSQPKNPEDDTIELLVTMDTKHSLPWFFPHQTVAHVRNVGWNHVTDHHIVVM